MDDLSKDLGKLKVKLLPEVGVLVVESNGPLNSGDFGKLGLVVDPWVEAHGRLRGIVAQSPNVSGLRDIRNMIQHIRFAQLQRSGLDRVAYVSDRLFPKVLSKLAGHMIDTKLEVFNVKSLPQAILWASTVQAIPIR
jgi:hypothetical protein